MMKYLQKLGRALMLPVACLPICGILMGLGYAIAPGVMGVPGAPTEGGAYVLGFFLVHAGSALIGHMALLFALGVAVGMSDDGEGAAAIAGLVSWLMIIGLLSTDVVSSFAPGLFHWMQVGQVCSACGAELGESQLVLAESTAKIAFDHIDNPFIGILCGLIGAGCCNRFKDVRLPDVLAFFSGRRCVAIVTGLISIVVAVVLLFVWPVVFSGLVSLGCGIKRLGPVGVGLYAFLNRLLIPTGLHHALNNVFWFDTIGLGDMTAFWAAKVQGNLTPNGTVIDWSVGSYMSGFFPCMMFGIPGAALAMIRSARPGKRRAAIGLVGSAAVCAFLCGITEPFEFGFMFLAFPLYVVYSLLYGIFAAVTVALGFRAGFCFSAGLTDLVFSASLPAAQKTWLILPLGLAAFAVFYGVFRFAIVRWNLKTPGRMEDPAGELQVELASTDYAAMAADLLAGLGGRDNILSADHCITRLRLEVKNHLLVDEQKLRAAGVAGVVRPGKTSVQIVIGSQVQFVYDEFRRLLRDPS